MLPWRLMPCGCTPTHLSLQYVICMFMALHMSKKFKRAGRVGMVLDEVTLPYIQLAPLKNLLPAGGTEGLLAGAERGEPPPPPPLQCYPKWAFGIQYFLGEMQD